MEIAGGKFSSRHPICKVTSHTVATTHNFFIFNQLETEEREGEGETVTEEGEERGWLENGGEKNKREEREGEAGKEGRKRRKEEGDRREGTGEGRTGEGKEGRKC